MSSFNNLIVKYAGAKRKACFVFCQRLLLRLLQERGRKRFEIGIQRQDIKMICTNLNIIYITWVLVIAAFMGYSLVLPSNFVCSWKHEWKGRFEKLEINYGENCSWRGPKTKKFINYFWQQRYRELPDPVVIWRGEKLRFNYAVMPPVILLLTACVWLIPELLCH